MGSLWDDRLAEVWAPPGRPGSGVVFGARGVLTARHVVAGAGDGVKARVVRRAQQRVGSWVSMRVVWESEAWDLALLMVREGDGGERNWLVPTSDPPVVVRLGGRAEPGCEAVGFPDQETHRPADGAARDLRQTEQATGTLLPGGQAKAPVTRGRVLPRAWLPLDTDSSTASTPEGWGGMSGAGVVLGDGRLAAVVVAVDRSHQLRRLYCVPLADVLDAEPALRTTLRRVTGAPVIATARHAATLRRALVSTCLGPDGMPLRLAEDLDLGSFGVKRVDLPGEPPYLRYVPRDGDGELRTALGEAARTGRMLLVVGKSGAGKSRSAAEAVRSRFPKHRLLRPVEGRLAETVELPHGDIGPSVVWLDDVERYHVGGLGEMLRRLLATGALVVATVRSDELAALTESHSPVGEALTDRTLVQQLVWRREWSDPERRRVPQRVAHPALRQAVALRVALGVWCVAGPQLIQRSLHSEPDDYPCRGHLLRAVLDWYRTGLTVPIPRSVAYDLVERGYLGRPAEDGELDEALEWALAPVAVGGRRSTHSLLMAPGTAGTLTVNDYVQDFDTRNAPPPVPHATWTAALDASAGDGDSLSAIGWRAGALGEREVARRAFEPAAHAGHAEAMGLYGLFAEDHDETLLWMRRAAQTGDAYALRNYGTFLVQDDPAEARVWFERAVEAGNDSAMLDLARLLDDDDTEAARTWYRRAADAGDEEALNGLGVLLLDEQPEEAAELFRRSAAQGNLLAMNNLGLLLADRDAEESERWFRRAAEAGSEEAMRNLGVVLADRGEDEDAMEWLQRAADAGQPGAMRGLGIQLSEGGLLHGARYWWLRAREAGNTEVLLNLAILAFRGGDLDGYQRWLERGVEAGESICVYSLGELHRQRGDLDAARTLLEQAAEDGLDAAMTALGLLVQDAEAARAWLRRAADAGHDEALYELGRRAADDGDPEAARAWWSRAAETGHADARVALALAVADEDPESAVPVLRAAAEAGDPRAMTGLAGLAGRAGVDGAEAEEWQNRADLRAVADVLLARDADPDPVRQALLSVVRDWERTGITRGVPRTVAFDLVNRVCLPDPVPIARLDEALAWALTPLSVEGRLTESALVYADEEDGALTAVGITDGRVPGPVPTQVLEAALAATGDDPETRSRVGWRALDDGCHDIALRAFEPLAHAGEPEAMGVYGLLVGVLIPPGDPEAHTEWWRRAAQTRDVFGMLHYGNRLAELGHDPEGARYWLREAAEAGMVLAMRSLGVLLAEDAPDEARRWLRSAAEAGDTDAMTDLGLMADREDDPVTARTWYRRAAYAGDPAGMNNLGLMLHDDDPEGARIWFRLSAEGGWDEGMRNLAITLLDEDPAEARHWLEEAAARGNATAVYNLGVLLMHDDPQAASRYWREATELGDPDAMNNLALELEAEGDDDTARDLLERAARTGNTNAMNSLGALLSRLGHDEEAQRWWEEAAEQGEATAMYNLGRLLYDQQDTAGARAWWDQAAAEGSREAMTGLAIMLEDEDPEAARTWRERAAEQEAEAASADN
ncbi:MULTISPECIES: trypsin-like peptidase domain-containing protein [unclassified Streptomyces]|uniref:trypsin-like peptidase domain-containing protein n=1 Tax=unclassified Streptomyces TaxID=2593676 RepID=UPI003326EFFD